MSHLTPPPQSRNAISELSSEFLGITTTTSTQGVALNHLLRHFEGIDGEVADKTDGYYQYRIELEILDKSIDILDGVRRNLDNVYIRGIKKYYTEATKLSQDRNGLPLGDGSQHVATSLAGRTIPRGEMKYGNFNSKTNSFTRNFSENYTDLSAGNFGELLDYQPNGDALGVAIDDPTNGFLQILKFLATQDSFDQLDWNKIETTLKNYLNPYSATPESINALIRLMEMVSNNLQSMISVVRTREKELIRNAQGNVMFLGFEKKEHVIGKNRTFKIVSLPTNTFNANRQSSLGFDFLNTSANSQSRLGLNVVPYSRYKRISQEQYTRLLNDYGDSSVSHELLPAGGTAGYPGENIYFGHNHGMFFSPNIIVSPAGSLNMEAAPYMDPAFLAAVPYGLYGNKTNAALLAELPAGMTSRRQTPLTEDNTIFSNDLATYFSTYHSTEVMTEKIYTRLQSELDRNLFQRESDEMSEGFGLTGGIRA